MKNKYLRWFLKFIIGVIIVGLAAIIIQQMLLTFEYEECLRLKDQSGQNFPNFYITQAEKDMCDSHNITVNAPLFETEEGYEVYDH